MADLDALPLEPGGDTGNQDPGPAPEGGQDGADSTPTWTKEQQAEFTKKTQALAKERKDWEAQRQRDKQEWENQVKQREAALQQQALLLQQLSRQGQSGQHQDPLSAIRAMDVIDGNSAGQLVDYLVSQAINPLSQHSQRLAQQNQYLYQQLGQINKIVQELAGKRAETDFGSLITRTREKLGYPDTDFINEALKDVYLSHQEDDDLRENFESLAKDRLDGLRKAFREYDRAQAKAARMNPIPKKGGTASPSSPAKQGYKSPKERADELWNMLEASKGDLE